MFSHQFPKEFQRCFAIPALRDVTFEHFAFVVNRPPQVVRLAVDLHEDLVQMPFPFARSQALDSALLNLGREHRTEPVPPKPDSLVANFDPSFVEQVFYIAERKWEPDVQHYCQADDLRTGFKVAEWVGFCHLAKLRTRYTRLKPVSSDSTL